MGGPWGRLRDSRTLPARRERVSGTEGSIYRYQVIGNSVRLGEKSILMVTYDVILGSPLH